MLVDFLWEDFMATNPPAGDGHRNGAVKGRSQTYNPKTSQYVKRNAETGRFGCKEKRNTFQRRS